MALAQGFEEDDAGSDGDVERFDGAGGGQRDDEVAAFARQVVEAFAFAAEDDADRGRVVGFGVAFIGAFIESDEPVACFLQFFHGAHEVRNLGDGQVRYGASGSTRDGVSESGGAAFGNDDAMRACGERRANDGAEIVGIFDAIEKHDESFASVIGAFVCGGENVFECGCGAHSSKCDDSLMIFGVGEAIELAAVFKADRDLTCAG